MRPQDVPDCVEMIAAHPIVGPRYGSAISHLRPAWLRLLSSDGFCSTAIIEEVVEGARSRILGVGVSVVLSDDFLRELKTPPFFWMGPELAKRVARGDDSALLTQGQIREANSSGGLNLAVWQGFVRAEDSNRAEFWSELMEVFLDNHRGFLFKEIVIQGESPVHLEALRHTGGLLLGSDGCYGVFRGSTCSNLLGSLISSVSRVSWRSSNSARGSALFFAISRLASVSPAANSDYSSRRSWVEQTRNSAALLNTSLSAVKKTWRSVYDRVAARLPELIPSNSQPDGDVSKRGRDKKQHLIAYLREHPEELRPVSRSVLRPGRAPGRSDPTDRSVS